MSTLQSDLLSITNNIPYYNQQNLLDYAIFLKQKSDKETDTQYLDSIPGMVDSILEASKEDFFDCSTSLDW